MGVQTETDFMANLGYPAYFQKILGVWKLLGVVAVLLPKTPVLKEWAYAGFFFAMTGAIASHFLSGDTVVDALPATLLLVLTIISWSLRPAARKVPSAK